MNILIVDDEIILQQQLKTEFAKKGFNVFVADNGETALDVLERESIDFVLSDVRMPIMDGFQFLVLARERYGIGLPIYLMTGAGPYLPIELEEAGAAGIIEKHLSFESIWDLLKFKQVEKKLKH
jgi:DNA-binding response OmpR family regulator